MGELRKSVKNQQRFYEFELPDGSRPTSYLPDHVKAIHTTRDNVLNSYLKRLKGRLTSALDVSCHGGFFSITVANHFSQVTGIDKKQKSLEKAQQIAALAPSVSVLKFILEYLGFSKIEFYSPKPTDYEQFSRGRRFILLAER